MMRSNTDQACCAGPQRRYPLRDFGVVEILHILVAYVHRRLNEIAVRVKVDQEANAPS